MNAVTINKMLVNLISKHKEVKALNKPGNSVEFIRGKNLARRVSRSIDNNAAGAGRDEKLKVMSAERPLRRMQRKIDRDSLRSLQRTDMVPVKGLKYYHLIAGIKQCLKRTVQCSRRSCADNNFTLRIKRHGRKSLLLQSESLPQLKQTGIMGIGVHPLPYRLRRTLKNSFRNWSVADPLGKIDTTNPTALNRHVTDFRLKHAGMTVT